MFPTPTIDVWFRVLKFIEIICFDNYFHIIMKKLKNKFTYLITFLNKQLTSSMHLNTKYQLKDIFCAENSSTCIRGLSQKINKRPLVVNNSIKEDVIEAQVCKKRDIRSGRNYYEGWDKYASNAMKVVKHSYFVLNSFE